MSFRTERSGVKNPLRTWNLELGTGNLSEQSGDPDLSGELGTVIFPKGWLRHERSPENRDGVKNSLQTGNCGGCGVTLPVALRRFPSVPIHRDVSRDGARPSPRCAPPLPVAADQNVALQPN
ncbi:hypothetical protein DRI50_07485 [candidate division KSB1 bacterium]|nr:MAG: hypothetical protein DRI50_07485 [candidate division KSB1 bacterium]